MKTKANPELARAINQQAFFLAHQSFASIRAAIQEKARALLRDGKSVDEVVSAVSQFGLGRPPTA